MSATQRNIDSPTKTLRSPGDFYRTPATTIESVLRELKREDADFRHIVDAGAGDGSISESVARAFPKADVVAVEINSTLQSAHKARNSRENVEYVNSNFLEYKPSTRPDLVISNPPFSLAQEFVEHALSMVRSGGVVCALLRLNWLGSKRRIEFHKQHPACVYVLPQRPSFTGAGTDATEYAWFVWGAGIPGTWEILGG